MAEPLIEEVLEERLQKVEAKERDAIVAAFRTAKDKRSQAQEALLKRYARDPRCQRRRAGQALPRIRRAADPVQKAVAERRKRMPPPLEPWRR